MRSFPKFWGGKGLNITLLKIITSTSSRIYPSGTPSFADFKYETRLVLFMNHVIIEKYDYKI